MKTLRCRDAGFDCEAVVQAETTEQVMEQVRPHARDVHGVEVTPDMEEQLTSLIREE